MLVFRGGTCELDSITRTLTFVRQTTLYPTLNLGARGDIANNLQKCYSFHLRTRFHSLTKRRPNLKNDNTNLLLYWRRRLGFGSRSVLAQGRYILLATSVMLRPEIFSSWRVYEHCFPLRSLGCLRLPLHCDRRPMHINTSVRVCAVRVRTCTGKFQREDIPLNRQHVNITQPR